MSRLLLSLALIPLAACSADADTDDADGPGSASQALDCGWIAAEDNCWRQAARRIAECVPQPDENGSITTGSLDEDALACTYDSGTAVRFDAPALPFDTSTIALTVEDDDGNQCARIEREMGSMTIETEAGIVDVQAALNSDGGYGLTLTCPDGISYGTDDFLGTMQSCEPDPSDWPGTVVEQTSTNFIGMDLAGGDGGQVQVFSCETAGG